VPTQQARNPPLSFNENSTMDKMLNVLEIVTYGRKGGKILTVEILHKLKKAKAKKTQLKIPRT
jgi:hypothetical protein